MKVWNALLVCLLIACGPVTVDAPQPSTQPSTDDSSYLVLELDAVVKAVCDENALQMLCAKSCYRHPDQSYCAKLDDYCATNPPTDQAFCAEWTQRRKP